MAGSETPIKVAKSSTKPILNSTKSTGPKYPKQKLLMLQFKFIKCNSIQNTFGKLELKI